MQDTKALGIDKTTSGKIDDTNNLHSLNSRSDNTMLNVGDGTRNLIVKTAPRSLQGNLNTVQRAQKVVLSGVAQNYKLKTICKIHQ